MKINLEVKVSEAAAITYALRELANRRRESAVEWARRSAEDLDVLAYRIDTEAHEQKPH